MRIVIALLIAICSASAFAQQPKPPQPASAAGLSIERFEGDTVQVPLGFGFILNRDSTLKREWFVVRDAKSPLAITNESGVSVVYESGERGARGKYQYSMTYRVAPKEAITAFEIRAVILDAFGRQVRTLSATRLVTLNGPDGFDSQWHIWSESEASQAFASVVYIAHVRTATGLVYIADRAAVFDQVRRIATRISEADLEPKVDTPTR